MTKNFKAAVLFKQKKKLKICNLRLPKMIAPGQVLVKLFYSGICGSQIGEIDGIKGPDRFLPHLLGHEGTGEILELGKNVKRFKRGDRVILHWMKGLGQDSITPRYSYKKNININAGRITTFNTRAIVSENRITKIPKGINLKDGVAYGCSLTTAYGVIKNDAKINHKDELLIFGSGNLGLWMVIFAKLFKCKKIVVVDLNKNKLKYATRYGADKVIEFKNLKDIDIKLNNFFGCSLPNIIIDNTGKKEIIEYAYNFLNKFGKLVLVGVPHYKKKISINTLPLHLGKKIVGSFGGGVNPSKDISKINSLLKKNNIKIKNLLGKKYKLSDINCAIKEMKENQNILKPIIELNE